eukprot:scaffold12084_cov50-Cylindrotheca_fusiformis.AAC.1
MGRKKLACQTVDDENTDVSCFESSENCQLSGFDREKAFLERDALELHHAVKHMFEFAQNNGKKR